MYINVISLVDQSADDEVPTAFGSIFDSDHHGGRAVDIYPIPVIALLGISYRRPVCSVVGLVSEEVERELVVGIRSGAVVDAVVIGG